MYQLLFMDSVPDHAAVAETVELAKAAKGAGFKFANAVLRRGTREARQILDSVGDSDPAAAAIRHSHPQWLVELWGGAPRPDGPPLPPGAGNPAPRRALPG